MPSVDTNVVARFLLGDDPVQSPIAQRIFAEGVFVSLTVLLETNWLLASRYRYDKSDVIGMFQILRSHRAVRIEAEEWLDWMLEQFNGGSDFADLVHLVASRHHESFITFDKPIQRRVPAVGPVRVVIAS